MSQTENSRGKIVMITGEMHNLKLKKNTKHESKRFDSLKRKLQAVV